MAARISAFGQTHAMDLIFFPLILLIFVGLVANAFQSSAIQTVPVLPTPTCSGVIEPGECYPTNVNGCDTAVSNCNFTSATQFSFLNENSPFTQLVSGNILGFIGSIFISTNAQGSNQLTELNDCKALQGTGQSITSFNCVGGASGNGCIIFPDANNFINATSNTGNTSDWSVIGWAYNPNNCNFAAVPTHYVTVTVYGYYVVLNATYYTLKFTYSPSLSVSVPNAFGVLGAIIGILLLFMGLGLSIAIQAVATGVSLGIDAQGARLAQAMGIGLFVWSFVYSEFGQSWLPNLPFNLGTIGFIILSVMFFLGLYWRIFSYN